MAQQHWDVALELAFIDESGNSDLDTTKSGASTHFVVSAVLVPELEVAKLREQLEAIRAQHFGTAEMKSSRIGNKHARRLRVLQAVVALEFRIATVVIDKRELHATGGLIYKQTFFKFLNGLLYSKLYRAFPSLVVYADEHGSREFMDGFVDYVKRRHRPNLFTRAEFEFLASASDVAIQLADLVAGTVAKIVDPATPPDKAAAFLDSLRPRITLFEQWPPRLHRFIDHFPREDRSDLDDVVANRSISGALEFIEANHREVDPMVARRVALLQYLLFEYRYVDAYRYISTSELRDHLADLFGEPISEHAFRSGLIAALRDAGVIIASSNKGYKLPASVGDLSDFADQAHGIVAPMLVRLKSARDQIRLATKGELDLLDQPRYAYIRRAIEAPLSLELSLSEEAEDDGS